MFIPERHEMILAKAEEVFNLIPDSRTMDMIAACRIHRLTMPAGTHGAITNCGAFAKIWDGFRHGREFPIRFGPKSNKHNALTNVEWWFVFILAWKHTNAFSSNSKLKTMALKFYLNYIRNLLTNKKPIVGSEQDVLKKVYQLYYNTDHVTLGDPAFRMAVNTALSMVVEGWSSRFNTFPIPTGTRRLFPCDLPYDMYQDIVDIHVDQRIALPDAIGIAVYNHRDALADMLQELLAAKPD